MSKLQQLKRAKEHETLATVCRLNPRDPRCRAFFARELPGGGGGGAGGSRQAFLQSQGRESIKSPESQAPTIIPPGGGKEKSKAADKEQPTEKLDDTSINKAPDKAPVGDSKVADLEEPMPKREQMPDGRVGMKSEPAEPLIEPNQPPGGLSPDLPNEEVPSKSIPEVGTKEMLGPSRAISSAPSSTAPTEPLTREPIAPKEMAGPRGLRARLPGEVQRADQLGNANVVRRLRNEKLFREPGGIKVNLADDIPNRFGARFAPESSPFRLLSTQTNVMGYTPYSGGISGTGQQADTGGYRMRTMVEKQPVEEMPVAEGAGAGEAGAGEAGAAAEGSEMVEAIETVAMF